MFFWVYFGKDEANGTNTGIPCFIMLCFSRCSFFFFWQIECLWHLLVSFSKALAHFMSVTFWWFSEYFKLFHHHYICYGHLWLMIFDVAIVIVLGYHKLYPYKTENLSINVVCVLTALQTGCSLSLSLFLGHPIPWDTKILVLLG